MKKIIVFLMACSLLTTSPITLADSSRQSNNFFDAWKETSWELNTASLSLEARYFFNEATSSKQHKANLSASFESTFYKNMYDDKLLLTFTPFLRADQGDKERTHGDIREFIALWADETWEASAGIGKVYWGVAESSHLVDIINQTDLIENIDGEDKLGQPMISLTFINEDYGTLATYLLPKFRERTFPGVKGRLRSIPHVDNDSPVYQSSQRDNHLDYALRYSKTLGDFDIGLSHFSGTSREPIFNVQFKTPSNIVLIPNYFLIKQSSLDFQATIEEWLFKFEGIYRSSDNDNYFAAVGGFEYTHSGAFDSSYDIGYLLEYNFDDRKDKALTPFQNDIFAGLRMVFNDEQSTEFLLGFIIDADNQGHSINLEGNRRIGDSMKLTIESRIYSHFPQNSLLSGFKNDDYLQAELAYYF
ncbi:MAG: hypothetical protein HON94_12320 [Methylococcales bacterium]|jgi:hypothetical protein|nr:hypothetical protein [Methylococcales bacterium]MBT7409112.1 hypothetical protein [Methylococcales bacterium]